MFVSVANHINQQEKRAINISVPGNFISQYADHLNIVLICAHELSENCAFL